MKINEKLTTQYADEIIEKGSNDIWKWTKYASGKIELTCLLQYTGLNCTTQSAGTYYGSSKSQSLPFTLSKVDFVGVRETGSRSSGIYVYKSDILAPYNTINFEFRAYASSNNCNCGVMVYIIGEI